ncbi:MAG: hypothetical protein K2I30_05240 [Clostridia bacterium]|nr:hypothetical protein [Clostridia bacterium]
MKVKKILRFYFSAESLERAFDNLIMRYACASAERDGERSAERILYVLGEKNELSKLWGYINTVVPTLSSAERKALEEYAALRCGIKKLGDEKRRLLRRSVIKFTRRARRLESFAEALRLVSKYYCLISPSP